MEVNRTEILKSYLAVRNLLALTNSQKNQLVNLSFEETATELFIKNGGTSRRLLLLSRSYFGKPHWYVSTTYIEAEPLASFLKVRVLFRDINRSTTERCFEAIEELLGYKV